MPWFKSLSKRINRDNVDLHDVWVSTQAVRQHIAGAHSMLSNLTHDFGALATDLRNVAVDVRAILAELKALRDNGQGTKDSAAAEPDQLPYNDSGDIGCGGVV